MDLGKIKKIVNSDDLPDVFKSKLIIDVIAKDKNSIPDILNILNSERKQKDELTSDMNLLLSKAHLGLEKPELNNDKYIQDEIVEFYKKYKGMVSHCF